jgi:hypothetical protein
LSGFWRAALLYAALTFVVALPISLHPGSQVLSDSADTDLFVWTLSWDVHALTHRPWAMFDANIFSPLRHTLAFSENLIGSALLAAPVIWLTRNPTLAMNLVALLSCVLCGAGCYLLARRAGVGAIGAVIAGLVFAFAPPRFLRLDQLFLATIEWIPFALAYFLAYLDRINGGRPRDLRIATAFGVLQVLTSGHGAVFLIVAALVLTTWRLAQATRATTLAGLSRIPRDLGVAGVALVAVVVLMLIPYRGAQVEMGLRRSLDDWRPSEAKSFLAAPTYAQEFLLSRVAPEARINQTADAYLFPGWMPLLLAGVALAIGRRTSAAAVEHAEAWRPWPLVAVIASAGTIVAALVGTVVLIQGPLRLKAGDVLLFSAREAWRAWLVAALCAGVRIAVVRRQRLAPAATARRLLSGVTSRFSTLRADSLTAYALLIVLSVWLAIGPPLGLWPYVYWIPGFNFIRASSRFTLLGVLGLAVLAGAGFEAATARLDRRRQAFAGVVVGALVFAECLVPLEGLPYRVNIPEVDRWLGSQPAPFVVAEVPLPPLQGVALFNKRQATYMLHSTAHWQKTVHGWSGVVPPDHLDLFDAMTHFPDADSLRLLTTFRVDYVVVHTGLYSPGEWPAIKQRIDAFQPGLTLVHEDASGRVYKVSPL